MPHYRATVHLLLEVENESEACDAISALLTETGLQDERTGLRDWAYAHGANSEKFVGPRPVFCPPDYDRDEDDLNQVRPSTRSILSAAGRLRRA